jgi:hypothetical protein
MGVEEVHGVHRLARRVEPICVVTGEYRVERRREAVDRVGAELDVHLLE